MARAAGSWALLSLLLASAAHARTETPDLDAERDRVIEALAHGVDSDKNVKRFTELLALRDAITPTSRAAHERMSDALKWRNAYRATTDWEVGEHCGLFGDKLPRAGSGGFLFAGDWGKVVRKEVVALPRKNELDPGEQLTLYEVAGAATRHVFAAEQLRSGHTPFEAAVGDLALVCSLGDVNDGRLPPSWGSKRASSGFAVRLDGPPKIVAKARFAPTPVTRGAFTTAVREVTWPWAGGTVVSNVELGRELAPGRFEVGSGPSRWIVDVPPNLPRRELLVPGHEVWLVLGQHRFDAQLRTLVLTVLDVEDRYVNAPP